MLNLHNGIKFYKWKEVLAKLRSSIDPLDQKIPDLKARDGSQCPMDIEKRTHLKQIGPYAGKKHDEIFLAINNKNR